MVEGFFSSLNCCCEKILEDLTRVLNLEARLLLALGCRSSEIHTGLVAASVRGSANKCGEFSNLGHSGIPCEKPHPSRPSHPSLPTASNDEMVRLKDLSANGGVLSIERDTTMYDAMCCKEGRRVYSDTRSIFDIASPVAASLGRF